MKKILIVLILFILSMTCVCCAYTTEESNIQSFRDLPKDCLHITEASTKAMPTASVILLRDEHGDITYSIDYVTDKYYFDRTESTMSEIYVYDNSDMDNLICIIRACDLPTLSYNDEFTLNGFKYITYTDDIGDKCIFKCTSQNTFRPKGVLFTCVNEDYGVWQTTVYRFMNRFYIDNISIGYANNVTLEDDVLYYQTNSSKVECVALSDEQTKDLLQKDINKSVNSYVNNDCVLLYSSEDVNVYIKTYSNYSLYIRVADAGDNAYFVCSQFLDVLSNR